MYLGLGNHDYANNVDDTYENHAANRMANYMIEHIKSNGASNWDFKVSDSYKFPELVTTTTGSLAYSWDIGQVHLVQLQNYPLYQRSWSNFVSHDGARRRTVNITNSLNWLANDLAKARQSGKIIILNYHDTDEHWGDRYSSSDAAKYAQQFSDLLKSYDVGAVFAGHYHTPLGKNTPSRSVPAYGNTGVFYCGSAIFSSYLLVGFSGNKMTVEYVSSKDGKSIRSNKTENDYPHIVPRRVKPLPRPLP